MERQGERILISSVLMGMGLYVPLLLIGSIVGAVLYGVIEAFAEFSDLTSAFHWVAFGVAGFFAGFVAATIGAWGSVFAHGLFHKQGSVMSAVYGTFGAAIILVVLALIATLTDDELGFGVNVAGMFLGTLAGTFYGAMKRAVREEVRNKQ
ncbi:MAG: hypothetical protein O7I42_19410 [Alphaproteobacteria bacterium]|nr:hypothetical protein [Alphaproteobacteria bacterium]